MEIIGYVLCGVAGLIAGIAGGWKAVVAVIIAQIGVWLVALN